MKADSYCSVDLPPYFVFDNLIAKVHEQLDGKTLANLSNHPRDYDDVNYTILNNKDGKYAWRPFQLIHPALYVSLVHYMTEDAHWNPRTYAVCAAILSKLLTFLKTDNKKIVLEKIQRKFKKIPNTGHLQIWLQRISQPEFQDMQYDEPLCQLVAGQPATIWNVDWISSNELKQAIDAGSVIDKDRLEKVEPIITSDEFELFIRKQLEEYGG